MAALLGRPKLFTFTDPAGPLRWAHHLLAETGNTADGECTGDSGEASGIIRKTRGITLTLGLLNGKLQSLYVRDER